MLFCAITDQLPESAAHSSCLLIWHTLSNSPYNYSLQEEMAWMQLNLDSANLRGPGELQLHR